MVGVDGHPADRVDGQVAARASPDAHRREQLDGLADVAQLLAPARLVEHAVDVGGQRGGVPSQQDLAADGLAGDAGGEVHRRAEEVAVALDAGP